MRIDTRTLHGVTIVEPQDRITIETQPEFTAAVRRLLDQGETRLVLDLQAVPYIDSCGIGAIAGAYVSARRRGGDLKLLHVVDRNQHVLEITRLLSVFEAFGSDVEAEMSFGPSASGPSAEAPSVSSSPRADH